MADIKQEVQDFYDQVGWQLIYDDLYQNARFEDLRKVSSDYIHRCHMRVSQHLKSEGKFLLDAGSGPVQYPEYIEYSCGYQYRICADISITALKEARKRLEDHGLYVVADIINLPFKSGVFEGMVSLHTIHHLPEEEHLQAYLELHRLLAPGCNAVVVNGWPTSRLLKSFEPLVRTAHRIRYLIYRLTDIESLDDEPTDTPVNRPTGRLRYYNNGPKGTFTSRHDVNWVENEIGALMPVEILVWRSVSVRFLRALIHTWLGGRNWLRLLFWLEERFPHFFGENGKYPLIVIHKDEEA